MADPAQDNVPTSTNTSGCQKQVSSSLAQLSLTSKQVKKNGTRQTRVEGVYTRRPHVPTLQIRKEPVTVEPGPREVAGHVARRKDKMVEALPPPSSKKAKQSNMGSSGGGGSDDDTREMGSGRENNSGNGDDGRDGEEEDSPALADLPTTQSDQESESGYESALEDPWPEDIWRDGPLPRQRLNNRQAAEQLEQDLLKTSHPLHIVAAVNALVRVVRDNGPIVGKETRNLVAEVIAKADEKRDFARSPGPTESREEILPPGGSFESCEGYRYTNDLETALLQDTALGSRTETYDLFSCGGGVWRFEYYEFLGTKGSNYTPIDVDSIARAGWKLSKSCGLYRPVDLFYACPGCAPSRYDHVKQYMVMGQSTSSDRYPRYCDCDRLRNVHIPEISISTLYRMIVEGVIKTSPPLLEL